MVHHIQLHQCDFLCQPLRRYPVSWTSLPYSLKYNSQDFQWLSGVNSNASKQGQSDIQKNRFHHIQHSGSLTGKFQGNSGQKQNSPANGQ